MPRYLRDGALVPSPPTSKGGEQLGAHGGKDRSLGGLPDHDGGPGPLREDAFVHPVEFPQQALGAIAGDGVSRALPGGDAHLAFSPTQGVAVHRIMRRVNAGALPHHLPELPVGAQALARGETPRAFPLGNGHFFPLTVTERRLRPLARRREMTFRPPGVDIRSRKPWVLFRRRLCGWYVRFMGISLLPSTRLAQVTGNI